MNKATFTLRNSKGFTLLEVTLFLAISAALAVIAIVGLAPRLRNVRFTSAVRGLETNLQSHLTQNEGQNTRSGITSCSYNGSSQAMVINPAGGDSSPGTAAECVLNGVVAIFDYNSATPSSSRILYRKIVSSRLPQGACNDSGLDKVIRCHKATLLDEVESPTNAIYNPEGGLTMQQPVFSAPANNGKIGFGYVQDPNATTRFQFIATPKNWGSGTLIFKGPLASGVNMYAAANDSFAACFQMDSRQVKFTFKNSLTEPDVAINEGCEA